MSGNQLLREYIREVLKEDDGGVYMDLAIADATQNPWGVSFGSGDDLYNIFVRPFTDVFNTAAGKTKELSQKAQTLGRVAFETIATTLIPVLTDDYNEIFKHDKENMDRIRQEYGEIYRSNWDAFKDNDVQLLMFMYDPARYVANKVARKVPAAALGLLSIVTGGTLDPYLDKVKDNLGIGNEEPPKTGLEREPEGPHKKKKNIDNIMGGYGGDMPYALEGALHEDEGQPKKPSLPDILSNPKLVAQVDNSNMARKMRAQAQAAIRQPLQQVYKQAQAVLKANSLQDLQTKVGHKLPGMDKLNQVPQQERQAAEQKMLVGVKKSMKAFYVKSLEQQMKKAADAAGDANHPLLRDYQQVLNKVKAL